MSEADPQIPDTHDPPLRAGSCLLAQPQYAQLVQAALLHFESQRYFLRAWCVMPNHVHVVVTLLAEPDLESILHSWKSFTAHRLNKLRGTTGECWMKETFTHPVRRGEHLRAYVDYAEQNSVVAGLCTAADAFPFSSAGAKFKASLQARFVEPKDTPWVDLQYRGRLPQPYKPLCTYFVTFRLADAVAGKS